MTDTENTQLRRALHRARWWAALATLFCLLLGIVVCVLSAWSMAFVQSTAWRAAFATPTWPPTPTWNYFEETPTPFGATPYPLSTAMPPTLVVMPPYGATPQSAQAVPLTGTGPITLAAGETRRFVFAPATPLVNILSASRLIVVLQGDSTVSPPRSLSVWSRALGAWSAYTPVWGENEIFAPEYQIGPAGEVFVEVFNALDTTVTLQNLAVAYILLDYGGASVFYGDWPTPMPATPVVITATPILEP